MAKYTLLVKNNSTLEGDICVYQTSPDINDPKVMSLAWFSEHAHPTTNLKFDWNLDYCFIWDETGVLKPGITFEASQMWKANLAGNNKVTLTYKNGAFTFSNQEAGPSDGILYIGEDRTIPIDTASVGIGMSGAGTFVSQASPNMNLSFTPHPVYWVTCGTFKQGQVLDTTEITNAAQVEFPPNVYTMLATLNPDNTWTVAPAQG